MINQNFNNNEKRLYLLTYDICGVVDKECYSALKELKEFSSKEEASSYHSDKITDMSNKTDKLKFKCNGGGIIDLVSYIKEQGFNYELVKIK